MSEKQRQACRETPAEECAEHCDHWCIGAARVSGDLGGSSLED